MMDHKDFSEAIRNGSTVLDRNVIADVIKTMGDEYDTLRDDLKAALTDAVNANGIAATRQVTINALTDKLRKAEQDMAFERASLAAYDGMTPADIATLTKTLDEAVAFGRAEKERADAAEKQVMELRAIADEAVKAEKDADQEYVRSLAREAGLRIRVEEATARADAAEKQVMELRAIAHKAMQHLYDGGDGDVAIAMKLEDALASTDDVAKRWVKREELEAAINLRDQTKSVLDDWLKEAGRFLRARDEANERAAMYQRAGSPSYEALCEVARERDRHLAETVKLARERDEAVRQRDGYADAMSRLRFALSVGGESRGAKDDEAAITKGIEMLTAPLMRERDEVGIQLAAAQAEIGRLRPVVDIALEVRDVEALESATDDDIFGSLRTEMLRALATLDAVPGDVLASPLAAPEAASPPGYGIPMEVAEVSDVLASCQVDPYDPPTATRQRNESSATIQTSGVAGAGAPFDEDLVRRAVALHQVSGLNADGVVAAMRPKRDPVLSTVRAATSPLDWDDSDD